MNREDIVNYFRAIADKENCVDCPIYEECTLDSNELCQIIGYNRIRL